MAFQAPYNQHSHKSLSNLTQTYLADSHPCSQHICPLGKYGIHGTDEPWSIGSPLSKGCIRMFNKDAAELKKIVYAGTKVTIIKGPYGAFGEGFRTLKPGSIGSDVYAVQKRLQELGYYNDWVDGKFGAGMQGAVSKFQKDKGLPQSKYINARFYNALGMELFE